MVDSVTQELMLLEHLKVIMEEMVSSQVVICRCWWWWRWWQVVLGQINPGPGDAGPGGLGKQIPSTFRNPIKQLWSTWYWILVLPLDGGLLVVVVVETKMLTTGKGSEGQGGGGVLLMEILVLVLVVIHLQQLADLELMLL